MKHVCIITYAFLPLNFVATWRQYYRAKYLACQGYYVTILTRHWDEKDQHRSTADTNAADTVREQLFQGVDIIRVPAGSNHLRHHLSPWQQSLLRMAMEGGRGLLRLIARQVAYFLMPMDYHLRMMCDKDQITSLMHRHPDVVIASGDPWHIFAIGDRLAAYWGSKLICEYRDPWNYTDDRFKVEGFNTFNRNPVSQMKRLLSRYRERQYTRNAQAIISVSEPWTNNAAAITGINNAYTITNGFEPEEFDKIDPKRHEVFTITYVGNLHAHPQQNIEPFLQGVDRFLDHPEVVTSQVKVQFVGTASSYNFARTERYLASSKYYREVFSITEHVDKFTSIREQKASHVLLFVAHQNVTGQYPAKIFEYMAAQRPIMLAPDDQDVCHQLIASTSTGRVCDTAIEVAEYLTVLYREWWVNGDVTYQPNNKEVENYTYERQNRKLINILENHI